MNISIRQYLKNFDAGMYDSPDVSIQINAGWYDWFCRDTSLRGKTVSLTKKLKRIVNSPLINQDTMYVFFKNNCPMYGSLYDDFRICDLETGDVIYCIIPFIGHDKDHGLAEVWSKGETVYIGRWTGVVNFFIGKK